jgi:hypothetical protein
MASISKQYQSNILLTSSFFSDFSILASSSSRRLDNSANHSNTLPKVPALATIPAQIPNNSDFDLVSFFGR